MTDSAAVIGAGPGLGAALARRFAREGLAAAPARRSAGSLDPLIADIEGAGGRAKGYGLDATDPAAVDAFVEAVEADLGPLRVLVFNAAAIARGPVAETDPAVARQMWETIAFAGFLSGRAAARRMSARGRGTIIFTGATASVKASAGFGAFAAAKHALRAFAQSLAKEVGPAGVHVAHTIIDGLIDSPRTRELASGQLDAAGEDGALAPDAIAEAYWRLHAQPRSAWTFELDLRPYKERW
ncbi:MAG: SDR family NAD(P)-dependent oxidoreductase [Caulobacterales bacterium]|nr:SDR family NAD(P)-dependent oxidoreductase [Caulobacterales bacterium]